MNLLKYIPFSRSRTMTQEPNPQLVYNAFGSDEVAISREYREITLLREAHVVLSYFIRTKARLLDIGCGYGRTTVPLAGLGYSVTGIDIVERMIATARAEYPHVDFRVMDVTSLDFPDNEFDYALFSFNGLDLVLPEQKRLQAMREIYRVLKPNGVFALNSHSWLPYLLWPPLWKGGRFMRFLRTEVLKQHWYHAGVAGEPLDCYISAPWRTIGQLHTVGFRCVRILPGLRPDLMRLLGQYLAVIPVLLSDIYPYFVARKMAASS
ncbi:MAG: class I SAM-dependent methyltransferase [Candidatus Atribacteria bacterium]|nr:class I SAM-dependent methyltransferase [Candidatus Atribacteria bacterium]